VHRARLALVLVSAALAAIFALGGCRGQGVENATFYGARLGMTMRDVRSAFTPPSPGTWTAVQDATVPRLDWASSVPSPPAPVASARFEFHNGMLVAIRAPLAAEDVHAAGPPVQTTSATVVARDKDGARVSYRWISRECPAHKDEVAKLLAR